MEIQKRDSNSLLVKDAMMFVMCRIDVRDIFVQPVLLGESEEWSYLIHHTPDEQFKMIRHYGMYSRKSKKLSRKLLSTWQKETRRWIVKIKKTLRRQTWRERITSSGEKRPNDISDM